MRYFSRLQRQVECIAACAGHDERKTNGEEHEARRSLEREKLRIARAPYDAFERHHRPEKRRQLCEIADEESCADGSFEEDCTVHDPRAFSDDDKSDIAQLSYSPRVPIGEVEEDQSSCDAQERDADGFEVEDLRKKAKHGKRIA